MPCVPAKSNGRCNVCTYTTFSGKQMPTRVILNERPGAINRCFQCGSNDVSFRYCDYCEQPIKLGEMHSWGRRIAWEAHERCLIEHGGEAPITRSKLNLTKKEQAEIEPEIDTTLVEFLELDEKQTARVEDPFEEVVEEVKPVAKPIAAKLPKLCRTFYDSVYLLIAARIHAYIYGPAGCGKSHIVEQAAKHYQMTFCAISLNVQTFPSALLGYCDQAGKYITTGFREVWENGGVFLIDEMDNASGNLLTTLNSGLANGFITFPDSAKPIYRHADCVIIATGNTTGRGKTAQYIGRQTLDAATLDRFVYLSHDYNEDLELEIAMGKEVTTTVGMVEYMPCEDMQKRIRWAKSVQKIRANARQHGLQTVVSMRPVVTGCKLLNHYSVGELAEMLILKGTDADTRAKLLQGAF